MKVTLSLRAPLRALDLSHKCRQGRRSSHSRLVLRYTGTSPAVHPLLYFINKNSVVYFFPLYDPLQGSVNHCGSHHFFQLPDAEILWKSAFLRPAARMPHALRGRTGKVSLVLGCSTYQGAMGWYNPAAARPDEGKQLNEETEICDCVRNMMVLCLLLH